MSNSRELGLGKVQVWAPVDVGKAIARDGSTVASTLSSSVSLARSRLRVVKMELRHKAGRCRHVDKLRRRAVNGSRWHNERVSNTACVGYSSRTRLVAHVVGCAKALVTNFVVASHIHGCMGIADKAMTL